MSAGESPGGHATSETAEIHLRGAPEFDGCQPAAQPGVFTASLYAALGEVEPALGSLERAYRERAPHLVFLKVAPEMDGLRSAGRFQQLLARIGLNGQRSAAVPA